MREKKSDKKREKKGQPGPTQIEIRDKWLDELPDLARAYWLKEEFSNILQLSDRQKAEELTDRWLERAAEFVLDFRAKYDTSAAGRVPFGNVVTTIKRWRPQILNYVDSKDRYGLTTTNYFAEHVNKKIKRAKALGNGTSFETLRMKVVHGGVMVQRRPPHPMGTLRPKARGRKRPHEENTEPNPDSNLEQLRRAREERDETKGLLPNPHDHPGWVSRFGQIVEFEPGTATFDELPDELGATQFAAIEAPEPRPKKVGRRRKRSRSGPNQQNPF
jgi:hypothetical protein